VLEVEELTCRYGSVTALRSASISVRAGEIFAVIGSNGAGKSTLIRAISGLLRPATGRVVFDGTPLPGADPGAVVRAGINVVPEGRHLFPQLSVADNLLLGGYVHRKDKDRVQAQLSRMLDRFPILRERADQPASQLSGGQQQMLAIAQAVMAEPRLLVLDEPSLGLAPSMVSNVFDVVRTLNEDGITVILVEQMVRQTLELATNGCVLQNGSVVLSGTAEELRRDPTVREAYLGLSAAAS
jgi:branched-chain amino acid transport system ATP-binding protein